MLTATNVKTVTIRDLLSTALGRCLVPDCLGFRVLLDADGDPCDPAQLVGGGELFRIPSQGLVMVGQHGTIVAATPTATAKPHPTIVAKQINRDGYYVVSDHYGCETHRVARLVASVWVPGRDDAAGKSEVDHVDGDRTNDDAANLEWVTHAENIRRSHQRPGRRPRRKWTPDDLVLLLPRHPGVGNGHIIVAETKYAARITGSTNISHCITYGDRCGCGDYYVVPLPYHMARYLRTKDKSLVGAYLCELDALLTDVSVIGRDPRTRHTDLFVDVYNLFIPFFILDMDRVMASPYWYAPDRDRVGGAA